MNKEEVFNLLKTKGGFYCQEKQFIKRFPDIYEDICRIDFPEDFNFSQKLYHYFMDDSDLKLGLCPVCGNRCKFISFGFGYQYHCSKKCSYVDDVVKNKRSQTCLEKYDVKSYTQSIEYKEKYKQTCFEKYGVNNFSKTNEYKNKTQQTSMKKYGTKYYVQTNEFKKKSKETCIRKYGYENYQCTKEYTKRVKETCLEKYSDENYRNSDKAIETKRKNHTFTTTSIEKYFSNYLTQSGIQFIRQYKSDLYPFNCDFYLPDYDLYIEIQGSWMHGDHPFDVNCKRDIDILNRWKEKSKLKPQYNSAIDVWTNKDIIKRNMAKQNNLNYLEIFSDRLEICIEELNKILKGEE